MDQLSALFDTYGLPLVFGSVFLEQMGPPIPSGPLLIVAGTLAKDGRVSLLTVAALAWVACMIGKIALYVAGGRYGRQAMDALCRFSISPDSRIRKTDRHFERWGASLLVVAEFIPGVRTLAPSLAGAEKVRLVPFLLYSGLGAALWTALYLGIGVLFRDQIDPVLVFLHQSGRIAIVAGGLAIAVYFLARWWRRRRSAKTVGAAQTEQIAP
jgi:membrane protein DedA with SNARE-associated domain